MKQRTSALLSLGMCVILAVTALVIAARNRTGGEETAQAARTVAAEGNGGSSLSVSFQGAETAPEPTDTPEPTPTAEPTAEPTATPEPTPETVVAEQPVTAPEGYFEDAAFVGNSLVTGLDIYDYDDVLAGADFYAANSVTVLGVSDYIRQMAGTTYGKVYVGLGTNEMSYEKETLRGCYNDMIDTLLEYNPDCIIYLMSVTPVSEYKSNSSSYFNKSLVLEYNEMLLDIARERGVYYLDVYSVLCDGNGYLPSDVTVDGVHFTPAHYTYWFDYLQTHYVLSAGDSLTGNTQEEPDPGDSVPAETE